jgi:hypothetical protein
MLLKTGLNWRIKSSGTTRLMLRERIGEKQANKKGVKNVHTKNGVFLVMLVVVYDLFVFIVVMICGHFVLDRIVAT